MPNINGKNMRILHICHSYYPPFLDCARQYAALFQGTPYQVLTVYLTGEYNQQVIEASASDEVVFLGYQSHQVKGLKLGAIAKIRKIVAKEPFLFCIAHRVKPTYIALLATKLPVISVHHNYNDYSRWSRRLLVNFYKDRMLMLGVSNAVRDDLRRDLKNWPLERIQTLYNRIDVSATQTQLLPRNVARVALNLPENSWVIGNVGRLHYDKDQATLIRGFALALPNLPEASLLLIIGAGPLEATLKQLAASLNVADKVIFGGQINNAKQYFKAFDLFALTSDREPFGMVLLEAMAAELPIICSDNGGGAEVVTGVGQPFKFGNAQDLSRKITEQSQSAKQDTTQLNLALNQTFSDQAAKRQFNKLTLVQTWLAGN